MRFRSNGFCRGLTRRSTRIGSSMNKLLSEIFAHKREPKSASAEGRPAARRDGPALVRAAAPPPRDFVAALRQARPRPALIAEIKRGSPSRGLLVADFDPLRLAAIYAENGAAAISVLTDERFFGGSLDHLRAVATGARRAGARPAPTAQRFHLRPVPGLPGARGRGGRDPADRRVAVAAAARRVAGVGARPRHGRAGGDARRSRA